MEKVAKARKSTHTKKKLTTELRGKVLRREEHETNKEYEFDEIGPIYLLWAKKKVRNEKGKTVTKSYIEKDEKHLIWVKWTKPFKGTEIYWSSEQQGKFENFSSSLNKLIVFRKFTWVRTGQTGGRSPAEQKNLALPIKARRRRLGMAGTCCFVQGQQIPNLAVKEKRRKGS